MSDTPPTDDPRPTPPPGRAQSVRLRDHGAVPTAGSTDVARRMDSANAALGDALRITYRLVQFAMVVLVLLFLGSGFRTIREGQRGLSVRMGRLVENNLPPGPHFAMPYPIGEVVSIGTGTNELRLDENKDFFPFVRNRAWNTAESKLPSVNQLDPAKDGSLITADLNIAHAQWTVNFRRDRVMHYATNVIPDSEHELVRSCVRRGIVRAVAEMPIDRFLKDRDTVAERAQAIAQMALDEIDSGIKIEQLSLNRKFPPVQLLERFAAVNTAAQTAGEARAKARTHAQNLLSAVGGQASVPLIGLIDEYERAIELGDDDQAVAALAVIDAVLSGHEAQLSEVTYEAGLVSGEISEILARATNTRITTVSDARAELQIYLAKAEQFRANPGLMLTREWSSGMSTLLSKPFVQSFTLRQGSGDSADIWLNEDPDIRRGFEMAQKQREATAAQEIRERAFRVDRYRVDEGLKDPGEEGM